MRSAAFVSLALLFAAPALAEVETYNIDPRHTFPAYEINHLTFSIQRGRFDETRGKITLDPATHSGTVEVAVDTASVSTGVAALDAKLRSGDFFDSANYPQMTFRSSDLVFDGDRLRQARGTLTILGVARPVTFDVTFFKCGGHPMLMRKVCGADMTATIRRSEFGMKYLLPTLGDEVLLRVNVEAIKDS